MKKVFPFSFLFLLSIASGQINFPSSYKVSASIQQHSTIPLSNSVSNIAISNDTIWLGTGRGLSRSTDGGRSWKNYFGTAEFGEEDISAIATRGKEIWVAVAHSVERNGESLPEGGGLRYSTDGGETWTVIAQPIDINNVDTLFWNDKSTIRALGITTAINNITYDIALTSNAVWITSFAGMVRKSTDTGNSWQRVIIPPDNLSSISLNDSLKFDLSPTGGALGLQSNLNHRAFSVLAENDSTIWIGTAGGINKTTDNGKSWVKFTSSNQVSPISGNFIVALAKQQWNGKDIIWAATNPTDSSEERSVSYSENGGITWKQTLMGEFAHNFGIKNEVVYTVSDNGIFRSNDFGNSWSQTGTIYDNNSRHRYTQTTFYSAASYGDTVWLGGTDGLVRTIDNANNYFGSNWTILHASQPLASANETYAYPNPFAPDDESIRIHYSTSGTQSNVTIRIFDFGMNLIRTVIQNAIRQGTQEQDEIWNGRDNNNNLVSNGVYFYQVSIGSEESRWGKILVIM